MARRVFVHIGLPKTATTYLQTILWSSRDRLLEDGVLLPGLGRFDHLWTSRIVREDPRLPKASEEHRTAWARLQAEIAAHDGDALITHEFFAAASADQAKRMAEALAPAEVHVVVTARDLLGLFTASWQESLKNRGTASMADYSREVSEDPRDVWNWRTLDLHLVLQRWSAAVAHERIHVLPLDTSAPREEIWHRFAGLLGLRADAYDLSQSFPNESMGVVEAEVLRRVNEHLVARKSLGAARDRGMFIRTFLADERLVPRRGEKFWPQPDRIEECRQRSEATLAYLRAHPVDVVGDLSRLEIPAELPARRTPDTVTEAEVAEAATDLVAMMLADVRELRVAPRVEPTSGKRGLLGALRRR
ncbi:hypothetical protein [Nocardioides daeguensis]|uniref:Sulfotransferase family protein n=1 Tax=Nocardioides daeguensis TaxID=908359 RepID=A0ABP6VX14_9ACTN|nr:hypothetical protein [Nocardioides daeguensis]MBV6728403.1 hypothetical protein [Nocardioides daeguensis]MCR1773827.1 hypothetical protein [Nocardioides daeguensis]